MEETDGIADHRYPFRVQNLLETRPYEKSGAIDTFSCAQKIRGCCGWCCGRQGESSGIGYGGKGRGQLNEYIVLPKLFFLLCVGFQKY